MYTEWGSLSKVQYIREKFASNEQVKMNFIRLLSPIKDFGGYNKQPTWQVSQHSTSISTTEENPKCAKKLDFLEDSLEPIECGEEVEHIEEDEEETEDLWSDFLDLSPEIRKTRSGLVYHAAYAGGAVVVGGLLAGPFGAMLGGIFGSMIGWKNADNYKSLLGAMKNMTDEEKVLLFDKLQKLLNANTRGALQNYAYKRIQENVVVRVAKTVTKPVRHPVDTFNTVTSPIFHPIQTASAVAAPIFHPIQTTCTIIDYLNPFSPTKSKAEAS